MSVQTHRFCLHAESISSVDISDKSAVSSSCECVASNGASLLLSKKYDKII